LFYRHSLPSVAIMLAFSSSACILPAVQLCFSIRHSNTVCHSCHFQFSGLVSPAALLGCDLTAFPSVDHIYFHLTTAGAFDLLPTSRTPALPRAGDAALHRTAGCVGVGVVRCGLLRHAFYARLAPPVLFSADNTTIHLYLCLRHPPGGFMCCRRSVATVRCGPGGLPCVAGVTPLCRVCCLLLVHLCTARFSVLGVLFLCGSSMTMDFFVLLSF